MTSLRRKDVLLIAGPIIVSNLSTPLLGLADTAVIGNLGDPALLGAIAIGGMIFSFVYWGFGFLRMGTTGLVAQAAGAGDQTEVVAALYRAALLAVGIGIALVICQYPISAAAFRLIDGSAAVESAAATYFTIRIWAAPVSLLNLVFLGYLLGHQRATTILVLQLLLNGTNIILDILFVVVLDWGVAGVAWATVTAECLAAAVGILLVHRHRLASYPVLQLTWQRVLDIPAMKRTLSVNRDIMIRTLCLIFAFAWFTNEGAGAGDVMLAANAILMQFVSFSAFFLDGYALAAESLTGNAVGARDHNLLQRTLRYISELGFTTAVGLTLAIVLAGPMVIDLLTTATDVRAASRDYLLWAVAAPTVSLWCYLLDGIFIGATCTREMRNAMVISLLGFLGAWYVFSGWLGNHGLWLSLHCYFVVRALTLLAYLARVLNLTESEPTART